MIRGSQFAVQLPSSWQRSTPNQCPSGECISPTIIERLISTPAHLAGCPAAALQYAAAVTAALLPVAPVACVPALPAALAAAATPDPPLSAAAAVAAVAAAAEAQSPARPAAASRADAPNSILVRWPAALCHWAAAKGLAVLRTPMQPAADDHHFVADEHHFAAAAKPSRPATQRAMARPQQLSCCHERAARLGQDSHAAALPPLQRRHHAGAWTAAGCVLFRHLPGLQALAAQRRPGPVEQQPPSPQLLPAAAGRPAAAAAGPAAGPVARPPPAATTLCQKGISWTRLDTLPKHFSRAPARCPSFVRCNTVCRQQSSGNCVQPEHLWRGWPCGVGRAAAVRPRGRCVWTCSTRAASRQSMPSRPRCQALM